MELCHLSAFISCFIFYIVHFHCVSGSFRYTICFHPVFEFVVSLLISSCPLCDLCRASRAGRHSSDHHALGSSCGTGSVCVSAPGWLCWDEHATAPDLCHPPWCHLVAGVGQWESEGQGQAGMWRVQKARMVTSASAVVVSAKGCISYIFDLRLHRSWTKRKWLTL